MALKDFNVSIHSPSIKEANAEYNKYTLEIFKDGEELHLRLDQIRELKNSNIMEIINGDLHEAYELYYDVENVAATMSFYCHDITPEKARKHLAHNRIMYVGEEHFIKKSKVV